MTAEKDILIFLSKIYMLEYTFNTLEQISIFTFMFTSAV